MSGPAGWPVSGGAGGGPGAVVAVAMPRSELLVVALLAVLKAGGGLPAGGSGVPGGAARDHAGGRGAGVRAERVRARGCRACRRRWSLVDDPVLGRRRGTALRAPVGPAAAGASGLRDLYLGFDRDPEGRRGRRTGSLVNYCLWAAGAYGAACRRGVAGAFVAVVRPDGDEPVRAAGRGRVLAVAGARAGLEPLAGVLEEPGRRRWCR